jgi:4-diphosphocytidyl-2C-methyl-D-erythritol kinase
MKQIFEIGDGALLGLAPAKLNVTLSIGKLDSTTGYHYVSSIMQSVSLFDYVTFVKSEDTQIYGSQIDGNIVESTLEKLSSHTGKRINAKIICHKVIPSAAGMGGGSSDAAMVLNLANIAYGLNMTQDELQEVAQSIGNDVAFLVNGGRAKVEGSKKHTITDMDVPELHYLIAHPRMEMSTREMYAEFDRSGRSFAEIAGERCPDISRLLGDISAGSEEHGMTGKGPTVFAGYKSYEIAAAAARKILGWFKGDTFIASSLPRIDPRIKA